MGSVYRKPSRGRRRWQMAFAPDSSGAAGSAVGVHVDGWVPLLSTSAGQPVDISRYYET